MVKKVASIEENRNMKKLAVVAIGGNSLIKDKQHQSINDQYAAVCETTKHIVDLIENDYDVVVSHGNGPQVGHSLRRAEIATEVDKLPAMPLVNCDADTQGSIGYQIQQALDNEFRKRQIRYTLNNDLLCKDILKTAVTIVTQVSVDKNDPAFKNPTKPIGTFYTEQEAEKIRTEKPEWKIVKDSNRGYRRVVPSPKPIEVLELEAAELLLKAGFCVIAGGGGGIPVIKTENNQWLGVDAVIDKDFATSLLANQLDADLLIISTGVEKVYINFAKHNQQGLDTVSVKEVKKLIDEGHFAPGSMLPKIEAAVKFIENGGNEAIITDPQNITKAIHRKTGTRIIK